MSEWRKLNKAPKDGTAIMMCYSDYSGSNVVAWFVSHESGDGKPSWNSIDDGCMAALEGNEVWTHMPYGYKHFPITYDLALVEIASLNETIDDLRAELVAERNMVKR